MDYFRKLLSLLDTEQEADRRSYESLTQSSGAAERRANGICWYPVAIRDTELGRGDYLTVEVERTTHQDILHQFRAGTPARLFSNHDAKTNRTDGIISWISGNRLKIILPADELPDWSRDGKLGIDLLFDDNSYDEMRQALRDAEKRMNHKEAGHLIRILTGQKESGFQSPATEKISPALNVSQNEAVNKIINANELAVVHGPPGTGKTTVLVEAIRQLINADRRKILVTAPSNAAVDLLSERLADTGLNVVRIGNPVRVSEKMQSLTLDARMDEHPMTKEVKKMKKRANEFRDMAHKYKRNFGKAEREQRKALFDEARAIMKDAAATEQYITDDILAKAQVITATLVGSNHQVLKNCEYAAVVIDEAGQALEPACWIPILKAQKLIMAGDHHQLPPTIKSQEAADAGLSTTLLEKSVSLHPEAVVMLREQYRMNKLIMGYSSNVFYNDQLTAHETVAEHSLFDEDQPLVFIDTAGCGFEEKQEHTSTSNPEEANFLFKQISGFVHDLLLVNTPESFPTIGIISPYKKQVELLKELILQSPLFKEISQKISVNTIDSFQGQERDIIYISLARSNADGRIGFLSEIRRMNVAMTRARKKLVVIGDSSTLSQSPFYAGFIEYAEKNNLYRSAWEFM